MTCRERSKKGKTKTIKLRIWPALKAYNYTNTGKYTHINDNTLVFFCCCWSGAKDNAIVTLNEMCLTLKNSLTLYRAYQVKTMKNFMRKKGSTQVTVRNKYLYEKKERIEPPNWVFSRYIYFGRSSLFFSPSFSTLFGYYCPHLVLSTWFYYHFPCAYRRYCCYYCCCWSVVILKTNWI